MLRRCFYSTDMRTKAQSLIDRLAAENASCNAFVSFASADDLCSQRLAAPSSGLLAGQLLAIKDNYLTARLPTTCASQILHPFPKFTQSTPLSSSSSSSTSSSLSSLSSSSEEYNIDATVVHLLRQSGALIVGKTNMDEFAMGSSTQHSVYGPTRHPFFPDRVAGGSSGGSACAVARNMAYAALGSDTGGSVRQPASYCGVVGLKPTYGLLSRWGLVAYASSLDTPGVLAASVDRAARVLTVLARHDPKDSTSYPLPPSIADAWSNLGLNPIQKNTNNNNSESNNSEKPILKLPADLKGVRIGIPREYHVAELSADALAHWEKTAAALQGLGATVVRDVPLPHTRYALPAYYVLASAEAASNLSRFDGVRYGHHLQHPSRAESFEAYVQENRSGGFGLEAQRRILLGTFVLSSAAFESHYLQAQKVRRLVAEDFDAAFQKYGLDALLCPTAPTPAFRLSDDATANRRGAAASSSNPVEEYANDVMTIPASLAGLPAISVNVASAPELPFGMQLIGNRFHEHTLLMLAQFLHQPYQQSIQVEQF